MADQKHPANREPPPPPPGALVAEMSPMPLTPEEEEQVAGLKNKLIPPLTESDLPGLPGKKHMK
jgi:hypothetical protein